ncbi:MAG TPA: FlgD immunoglobulin-like domain containing protein [Candidatus Binatia bacterium]|nr:FlgD immunoglobulin-like domain containing protein [Candidatus Binatia bacterium]
MPRLLGRVRAALCVALCFAIAPLAVSRSQAQTAGLAVTLLWTATGDNGIVGQAAKYDLRYTATAVSGTDTLAWWNKAAVVNMSGHVPPPSGARDSVVIAGLVLGKKYFAVLRVADASGNWSGFSNMATIDLTKNVTGVDIAELGAPKLVIGAPYPSPTSGAAQIALTLARSGPLAAEVFDARGRLVRSLHSGAMEAGPHTLRWDGASESGQHAAAGVYWIRVAAPGIQKSVKLVVVR